MVVVTYRCCSSKANSGVKIKAQQKRETWPIMNHMHFLLELIEANAG